jgi:BirA family biotin operon repressor/biotin-[acetyl-CoA-carboxylase] ligase
MSASALALWEGHDAAFWRRTWQAGEVQLFATVASTNDIAARRGAENAPDFSIVLAEEQTLGRGRGGSRWRARAGSSLLFSVLFHVPKRGTAPGGAPVRVGLAVADAISDIAGLDAGVKWPNDVVIPGHGKVAGILCEGAFGHGRDGYVVAGIGVNVSQSAAEFVGDLRGRACSLHSATGQAVDRAELLTAVLEQLRGLTGRIIEPLAPEELSRLAQRDVLRDRDVVCDNGSGQTTVGIARGVGADGALLIEQHGRLTGLYTGSVRLAETHAYPGST